ncbi:PIN-like domain-containing protein [Streptomyces flaveolus]|uniref:PIN-like domain-containing protein n=1 Tax=Streptomyces flaveolus TaxID=67297 RepID=UPI0033BBF71B
MSDEATTSGGVPELASKRGIYDCDDAYRTPSKANYERLFTSGIIVLDTNVLLNLYRSNERTRKDTFTVLSKVKERLWIPHQVLSEFWRNRDLPSVRGHHKSKARDACSALDKTSRAMKDALDRWLKDVHLINDDQANKRVNAARESVTKTLAQLKEFIESQAQKDALEGTASTLTDPILQSLEPLLEGRVGSAFTEEEYTKALAEAARRVNEKIPPGYEDSAKDPERAAGDYLVWAQLLNEAEQRRRDVLLVTGDVKEDWWESLDGRGLARPRTELRVELRRRASVDLYMMTPSQLLTQADRVFGLKVDERSVNDLATSEAVESAKWLPKSLMSTIPSILLQAHERAAQAANVAGTKRSPYGQVIQAAFLEDINDAVSTLGGISAFVNGETYPVIGDRLLFPFRYSDHHANVDHALRYLNNRKPMRHTLAALLRQPEALAFSEIRLTSEVPGLMSPPGPDMRPILILYTSNAEEGILQAYLATLVIDHRGELDFEYVREL